MAAKLCVITDPKQWEVISTLLCEIEEGAIIIGPHAAAAFKEKYDKDPEDCPTKFLKYDFGGQADAWIDWTDNEELSDPCLSPVREDLGIKDPEFD